MYPEYHTSLDNFNIVKKKNIFDSYNFAKLVIKNLLNSIIPINKIYCEPFLSKRNLYSTISIKKNRNLKAKKILDFLQYADGKNDLVAISEYINLSLAEVKKIYNIVLKYKLVNNIF
jgi:aminopeptidase-like protein